VNHGCDAKASVMPSTKYSWSGRPDRLPSGSTAIAASPGRRGVATRDAGAAVVASVGAMPEAGAPW
jgi:hypothetical protein